jgi:hypothetical protein
MYKTIWTKPNNLFVVIKWNQKYNTVGTILKSNIKIVERGKIHGHKTQEHDRSLSWLGTGTSTKSGGFKLVL